MQKCSLNRVRLSGKRARGVLGFCHYPINPGRFSNQYRTGADRCTTGFLLSAMNTQYEEVGRCGRNPVCRFSPKCREHTQEQEIEIG